MRCFCSSVPSAMRVGPTLLRVSRGSGTPAQCDSSTKIIWSIGPAGLAAELGATRGRASRPHPSAGCSGCRSARSAGPPRPRPPGPAKYERNRRFSSPALRSAPGAPDHPWSATIPIRRPSAHRLALPSGHERHPAPTPPGRAVLGAGKDRRGHRGNPRDRSDDRRGFVAAGATVSSPRARPKRSRPPWPNSRPSAMLGVRRRPVHRGRRPATSPSAVAADHRRWTCWSTTPGPPGGRRSAEHDTASWDRVLDLNVQGVFHTTKFFLPLLEAAATPDDPSRVINIGSIDGIHVPVLESYSYSASKAAVHQLTRHLAKRLAPTITVNAVAPGPFESKMMAATLEAFGDQIAAARTDQADRPAGRHGRGGHLPGLAGRRLRHRRHHPGRRGHRHHRVNRAGRPGPDPGDQAVTRASSRARVRSMSRRVFARVDVAQLEQHPLVVGRDIPATRTTGSRRRPARGGSARSVRRSPGPRLPRARSARRCDGPPRTRPPD